MVLTEDEVLME